MPEVDAWWRQESAEIEGKIRSLTNEQLDKTKDFLLCVAKDLDFFFRVTGAWALNDSQETGSELLHQVNNTVALECPKEVYQEVLSKSFRLYNL